MLTRISFCSILFLGSLASLLSAEEKRPNIVWLISEDNSKHYLKLFDEHGIETPNISRLAQNGLIFERAFSNAPVCSVARTTLITGCYAPRIGTQYHRKIKTVPLTEGVEMFPALLRKAGYYTTNNVKKDYNAIEPPGVWDASSRKATWRNRKPNQPFFHMQSFAQSHEGKLHFTREQYETEPTTTNKESVFVAPYHPQTDLFRYTNALYRDRIQVVDQAIGKVIKQLESDGLIEDTFVFYFGDHGGVLPRSKGYLYESGLHVPLIVRIPENFKHLVEFDVSQNQRLGGFVNFVDFAPTVLKLAGVETAADLDGKAFLGTGVTLDELNRRDSAFGYADRFDAKYDLVRSLRIGRYKYIRNFQPFNYDGLENSYRYRMLAYQEWRSLFHANQLNEIQRQFFLSKPAEALFDLQEDPHETNNLARLPKMAQRVGEMRNALTEKLKSINDLGFYPESYLIKQAFEDPTGFGTTHSLEIGKLIDVANLQVDRSKFESEIADALQSSSPWIRYWALTACSSFDGAAKTNYELINSIANMDPQLLNRTRSAECLAMAGLVDPAPVIEKVLQETKSQSEAGLILNTVVLLRDRYGFEFDVHRDWFDANDTPRQDTVARRLKYLLGD